MSSTNVYKRAENSVSDTDLESSVYKSRKLNETRQHSILSTESKINPPKIVEYSSVYDYDERRLLTKKCQGRYYNLCPVKSMKLEISNKPFVHMSVEEVSLVTSLENWANHNVRVHGKFITYGEYYFLEDTGKLKSKIELDVSLLAKHISDNLIIQVFGELVCIDNRPKIQVLFFRHFDKMDLAKFSKVIENLKPYVPLFANRCKTKDCTLSDTIVDWDLNSQAPVDPCFSD